MSALRPIAGAGLHAGAKGTPAIVGALSGQLWSLRETVAGLNADVYRAAQGRSSGSIGGHVRHCLDHVSALFSAGPELTYDSRLRGTRVEADPAAALDELDCLLLALEDIGPAALHEPMRLATLVDRNGPVVRVRTTLGREIAFVLQHTIHHCAIVAVLLERSDIGVVPRFGYAPSTPMGRAEMLLTEGRHAISSACGPPEDSEVFRAPQRARVGVGPHEQ